MLEKGSIGCILPKNYQQKNNQFVFILLVNQPTIQLRPSS